MNTLFYVPMYHFRENAWARWLVTAKTENEAAVMVELQMGLNWRVGQIRAVCRTPASVFMEV